MQTNNYVTHPIRSVFGLAWGGMQQRLLVEHSLTFDLAYDLVVTADATLQHQRDIRKKREQSEDVDGTTELKTAKVPDSARSGSCYGCADKHTHFLCRFKEFVCYSYENDRHIKNVCRSKTVINKRGKKEPKKEGNCINEMDELSSICEVHE